MKEGYQPKNLTDKNIVPPTEGTGEINSFKNWVDNYSNPTGINEAINEILKSFETTQLDAFIGGYRQKEEEDKNFLLELEKIKPKNGELDSPYKAIFFLGKDVYNEEGKYSGQLTAILETKVEVKFDGEHSLIDYPIYYNIIKNKGIKDV